MINGSNKYLFIILLLINATKRQKINYYNVLYEMFTKVTLQTHKEHSYVLESFSFVILVYLFWDMPKLVEIALDLSVIQYDSM